MVQPFELLAPGIAFRVSCNFEKFDFRQHQIRVIPKPAEVIDIQFIINDYPDHTATGPPGKRKADLYGWRMPAKSARLELNITDSFLATNDEIVTTGVELGPQDLDVKSARSP
jgi:hypothetical protein